jgi:hypothetical protein
MRMAKPQVLRGFIALADPDGREIEGTRQPWKGDTGYSWDGAQIGHMAVVSGVLICRPFALQERIVRHKPSDVVQINAGDLVFPM